MMDLLLATSGGESQSASGGYVDDVFSAFTYTGNGSTQTINNGIDLAGKGGLVWTKSRTSTEAHLLYDTARGVNYSLQTQNADASTFGAATLTAFNSNGFTLGSNGNDVVNYVSWTFRKAPKFFDVVTYTGDGVAGRQIAHSLGVQAGFVTVKATSTTGDWNSYHRSATGDLKLNLTDAQTASRSIITAADASTFTVSGAANTNGVSYVAYLWAHDPSADGIIQCGSFTTDGSGNAAVNLGWEPQYLIVKQSNTSDNWTIFDSARDMSLSDSRLLYANTSGVEIVNGVSAIRVSAVGFTAALAANRTYIYLAIRRPNKPPTSGTQVYNAIARTGTGAAATVTGVGFAPDLVMFQQRNGANNGNIVYDRLRGANRDLFSSNTGPELTTAEALNSYDMDGVTLGTNSGGNRTNWDTFTYINHFFKRAKGFFDVVCDTGTGAPHGITHGLSVAPEFIIRKSRSGATQWECWHSALAATEKLVLNSTAAKATDATAWNSTLPTPMQFTIGTGANVNTNAATYVTYLFATLAGISKVGSYTGNGTSQTINCGFSTGSRFILVKRTDATGDWYVWDSVRGIIAANDPHLSLNTTAAEVTTDDSVDPEASGFIVNQNTATNINVNGGQYIFLSIA